MCASSKCLVIEAIHKATRSRAPNAGAHPASVAILGTLLHIAKDFIKLLHPAKDSGVRHPHHTFNVHWPLTDVAICC